MYRLAAPFHIGGGDGNSVRYFSRFIERIFSSIWLRYQMMQPAYLVFHLQRTDNLLTRKLFIHRRDFIENDGRCIVLVSVQNGPLINLGFAQMIPRKRDDKKRVKIRR